MDQNRREFLRRGLAGLAGLTIPSYAWAGDLQFPLNYTADLGSDLDAHLAGKMQRLAEYIVEATPWSSSNFVSQEERAGVITVRSGERFETETEIDGDSYQLLLENHSDQTPDRLILTWIHGDYEARLIDEGLDGRLNRAELRPLDWATVTVQDREEMSGETAKYIQTLYENVVDRLLDHYGINVE